MRLLQIAILLSLLPVVPVFGWGQPRHAVTRGALDVLPAWQKALLGDEFTRLGDNYSMIPDNVYTDKENAKVEDPAPAHAAQEVTSCVSTTFALEFS